MGSGLSVAHSHCLESQVNLVASAAAARAKKSGDGTVAYLILPDGRARIAVQKFNREDEYENILSTSIIAYE